MKKKLTELYIINGIYPIIHQDNIFKSLVPGNLKNKKGVTIQKGVSFHHGDLTKVGNFVFIGQNTFIDYCLEIGSFTSISNDVKIGLRSHPLNFLSTSPATYDKRKGIIAQNTFNDKSDGSTTIGHDVLISANVIILSGVKIGHGAVIGAGAFVNRDIPPYAIAVGIPSKVIKYRFSQDVIKELINSRWWELEIDNLKSFSPYFNDAEAFLEKLQKSKSI